MSETRTAYRTCPLCEASCGLEITVNISRTASGVEESVGRIRGDMLDVFSRGFICPKGSTLAQLHDDPDRLRKPLVKRDGVHVEVEWDEAWSEVAGRLQDFIERRGRNAIGTYLGNPGAHSLSLLLYNRHLLTGLGTFNRFSASTVDQMPKQVAGGYMFGTGVSVPVPDLDRTDLLVLVGANPFASNGSLCTAPDFPGRLRAVRERGGRVICIDPRRTKTAEESDQWIAIRPGTDAMFMMAVINVIFDEGLVALGDRLAAMTTGLDELRVASSSFTPESVVAATGVDAETIRRFAREVCAAPSAAVYSRIGVSTTEFGTTATWLCDAVNVLSGNLDRVGGVMFTRPVTGGPTTRGKPGIGSGFRIGRGGGRTKVNGYPEVMGEYPASAMAEEILDAGDERIRAMVTVAGNPVLSTPNSNRLTEAFEDLELMISVDIYLNETTRHADIILPPPSQLQKDHYDVALLPYAIRNVANYSEPVLALDEGQPQEWEILARLSLIAQGYGPQADPGVADDLVLENMVRGAIADPTSNIHGRDADEILAALNTDGRRGPARMLDFMLQTGPYGAAFGAKPGGASLQLLLDNPHGIDYGPLEPRLPEALRTKSGRIELAPVELLADVPRLSSARAEFAARDMVLIGRRHLKSNNSWMHNVPVLMKGDMECLLQMHPTDAERLGIRDGGEALVTSRVGKVKVWVEHTDAVRPGVVSLPHGWGHDQPGTRLKVAAARPGVNSNVLTDHLALDPLSGTAVLNGIPVSVTAV